MTSNIACPRCGSAKISVRNYARKAGSVIGTVAGATGSVAASRTGAALGAIVGPARSVVGRVAGAVIDALCGGAAGCNTGAVLGNAIDDNVLDNFDCVSCGHRFGKRRQDKRHS